MPCVDEKVIGAIDTHKDLHFAAVVDVGGNVLGTGKVLRMTSRPATAADESPWSRAAAFLTAASRGN